MPVTLDSTTKDDSLTAIRDRMANGTIEIGTSGMGAVIATFGLSATGGTVSSNVWTLALDASPVTASSTNTAAAAQIKDSGGTVRISGLTVGTSGTDIVLDSVTITSGQNVDVSSATITHA